MEFEAPFFPMPITRSRVMLEAASELVGMKMWSYRQARISLRDQEEGEWRVSLFGSDNIDVIEAVDRGEVHIATLNPAAPLSLAYRGSGPFKAPIDVRAIAIIPSFDQLAFAVAKETGLQSLSDIAERRFPLRVSLRGQRSHSVHFVLKEVLTRAGFSLEDIISWGGQIRYDQGLPDGPNRLGAVKRGEVDAIFDEAVVFWANQALDLEMRILSVEGKHLECLEDLGFRRGAISKADYPKLPTEVMTVDFSGFPIFTHARVADEVVRAFCIALERRKDRIPWEGKGALPLERMCRDTLEGPLDIPLHPAAENFWRERGYLS
jgi:TRAP-type uncharacterized transport system substrate-binding protein